MDDANTRIIRYDGTILNGYPINHISKGISISDINNDFGKEIATGTANDEFLVGSGKLYALNLNGQVVNGFPLQFLYHRILITSCSVDDLDGD